MASVASVAGAQTADERRAAGQAYNRGSTAYLAENWAEAARWFETAHRLAPAAPALVQAVRSHRFAGNELRAATLSLRLLDLYEDNENAASTAREVLSESAERFVRVDVVCDECSVELDGTLQDSPSFFVSPREEHTVRGSFDTGVVSETVRAPAGARREVTMEAPPAPPEGVVIPPNGGGGDGDGDAVRPDSVDEGSSGLSPIFFISAAALTVGAGAVLIWSGVDALNGVAAYEANATEETLAEGQSKELRTNIMIGVTAGLGAVTVLLAVLTDWGGSDEDDVAVSITPLPGGGAATVGGRF